jgi:hypothetical protein
MWAIGPRRQDGKSSVVGRESWDDESQLLKANGQ